MTTEIAQRQREQTKRTVMFDAAHTVSMTIAALKDTRQGEPFCFKTEDGNFAIAPRLTMSANWLSYDVATYPDSYTNWERVVLQVVAATMQLVAYKLENPETKHAFQHWLNGLIHELDRLYEGIEELRKEN